MSLYRLFASFLLATSAPALWAGGVAESIGISGFTYVPGSVTIDVGETVSIAATQSHPLRLDDMVEIACDEECQITYLSVGDFGFYCNFHGGPNGVGMSGSVAVQENTDVVFVGTFQHTLML